MSTRRPTTTVSHDSVNHRRRAFLRSDRETRGLRKLTSKLLSLFGLKSTRETEKRESRGDRSTIRVQPSAATAAEPSRAQNPDFHRPHHRSPDGGFISRAEEISHETFA